MKSDYKILHLEDVATDAQLVANELGKNDFDFDYNIVQTFDEYVWALDHFKADIVLCGHSLPPFNSLKAFQMLKQQKRKVPFILISSITSDDLSMDLMTMGADDFLIQGRLNRLPYAVIDAIEKSEVEKDGEQFLATASEKEIQANLLLQQLSEKLLLATEVAGLGLWEFFPQSDEILVNDILLRLYGKTRELFDGTSSFFQKCIHPQDIARFNTEVAEGMAAENFTLEFRIILPNGKIKFLKSNINNQRNEEGTIIKIIGTSQDVSKEKLKELVTAEREEKYRSFFENSMDGIILSIPNGFVTAANAAAQIIFKMTEMELCRLTRNELFDFEDDRLAPFITERKKNGKAKGEFRLCRKDGTRFEAEVSSAIFNDEYGNKRSSLIIRDISERKSVQETVINSSIALQQALDDLKKIMDTSIDIICTINKDGRFVNISSACEQIWQYSPSELTGKKFSRFLLEDDLDITLNVAREVILGKRINMFQNRYVRKDGKVVPMLWSAKWDEKEQLMICVAKDATEKVRLERGFEYERKRFQEMFYQVPSSIGALKGKEHRFELANDNYLKLIGKTDVIGKTVEEIMPEVKDQGFIKILDKVFETGDAFTAKEMQIQIDVDDSGCPSNLYLNFIYQPYRNKNGEIEGIFFFANDVTEQVVARKEISIEKANLQAILNNTDVSYILLDKNLKIIAFNKKANENMLAAYGIPLTTDVQYFEFFTGEFADEAKKNIELVFAGEAVESEVHFNTRSGETCWFQYKMNPILMENSIDGVCIAAKEITREKEAIIEKEKITQDLLQHNHDLEQFNYIVSHNLRAPVANISGAVAILNQHDLAPDTKVSILDSLTISVERLDVIIKDLNDILEIKKKQEYAKEYVAFERLKNNVKESIAELISAANIDIITDFTEVEGMSAVKSYIYSIFYNLISNSIKYRRTNKKSFLKITSKKVGNGLQLQFTDNGMGFDSETKKDHVFKLYKRLHNHVDGKGIGLFIVKNQVEAMGGSISVTSSINVGTTFNITF